MEVYWGDAASDEHLDTMNQTAALQGDALHAFLDQAQELVLNNYDDDGKASAISHEDRVAASVELMEQQSFAPATALELERLHDVWLLLNKPETANAVLQAERWLLRDGPRTLWVGVWSENFGAQRFYARHGFERVGTYAFPVGRVRDLEFILRRPAQAGA